MRRTLRSRWLPLALGGLLVAAASVGLHADSLQQYWLLESIAYPGKCMDVYRGDLSDGNHIDVYSCQSSVNQKFTRQDDGHVIVQNGQTGPRGYQMCMDYYPTTGRVGDPVRIWPCRPLTGPADSQHWYYLASGQWLGGSGNCVSAPAGTNGTQLVMAACNPTSPPANTRFRSRS